MSRVSRIITKKCLEYGDEFNVFGYESHSHCTTCTACQKRYL